MKLFIGCNSHSSECCYSAFLFSCVISVDYRVFDTKIIMMIAKTKSRLDLTVKKPALCSAGSDVGSVSNCRSLVSEKLNSVRIQLIEMDL